ncbi:LysE family translocator [Magnetovibrio sp.]|uniref:LysE family translocator n=1 Tax=Magnetovibrio sp. TaxID=2024836 RepID=UPI002F932DE7
MADLTLLAVFVPTFFFVSLTPGLCMTLALTMGMTIGVRKTLWMMTGELLGVGLVAASAVMGVAAILTQSPELFLILKYGGGAYLAYLGVQLWLSKGRMALRLDDDNAAPQPRRGELALQGFITAISNPKAWAFMVALLPPFIDLERAVAPQLAILVALILVMEFVCLVIYASGGKTLRKFLQNSGNVRLLNRVAGSLMVGVGGWLAFL